MDNSETYVKMNEKLPDDFPHKYRLDYGDYHYDKSKGRVYLHTAPTLIVSVTNKADIPFIKLYRQDQLQEIVKEAIGFRDYQRIWSEYKTPVCLTYYLMCFAYEQDMGGDFHEPTEYANQFTSMEQLWLAFVMKEKYNKIWDGENWRKAK